MTPEEKRAYHSRAIMASQRRHPEKHAARQAVRSAVHSGKMLPARDLPCVDCRAPAREYDHAHGYAPGLRLLVEAVCVPCHRVRTIARGETRRGVRDGLPGEGVPIQLPVRVTRRLKDRIEAAADVSGLSVSDWVRCVLSRSADLERARGKVKRP